MKCIKFDLNKEAEDYSNLEYIDVSDNTKIRSTSGFNFLSMNINDNHQYFSKKQQLSMVNDLFLKNNFTYQNELKKDIKQKLNSYSSQDKIKQIYNKELFITYDQVIEKLHYSKLQCYYCECEIKAVYEYKRSPTQWTLDRINNSDGHNNNNVVIACLKCNLRRRCQNSDKFLFTKRLNIVKI